MKLSNDVASSTSPDSDDRWDSTSSGFQSSVGCDLGRIQLGGAKDSQRFYSFHFDNDAWRAQQVRKMGVLGSNEPVSPNDWEEVKRGGNAAIQKWIADQMKGRTCAVVLVGSQTASRQWVRYQIVKAWSDGLGGVDSRDSLLGANQIQGFFLGGSLECHGAFGIERRGVGADGAADHRATRSEGLHRARQSDVRGRCAVDRAYGFSLA